MYVCMYVYVCVCMYVYLYAIPFLFLRVKDKSWQKLYVCLQGYELLFYPDIKAKDNGNNPTTVFCLLQTTVSPYNKDKRKNNVFQVQCNQCECIGRMEEWWVVFHVVVVNFVHLARCLLLLLLLLLLLVVVLVSGVK